MEKATARLGDAAVDPAMWPEVMDALCAAAGATGAALLQSDVRTGDVPRTSSLDDLAEVYFRDKWDTRDLRTRGVPLLLRGESVFTDQDCVTPEEMQRHSF